MRRLLLAPLLGCLALSDPATAEVIRFEVLRERPRLRGPQLRRRRPLCADHRARHHRGRPGRPAQRRHRRHRPGAAQRPGPGGGDGRRGDPAPRRPGARQRHAAGGRAEPRPQAGAAAVRRRAAARRQPRRRPRMPASASCTAGLHHGLDRLAGRHPLRSRRSWRCAAPVLRGRDRPGAGGVPVRPRAQPGHRHAVLADRRSRDAGGDGARRAGTTRGRRPRASPSASPARGRWRSPGPPGLRRRRALRGDLHRRAIRRCWASASPRCATSPPSCGATRGAANPLAANGRSTVQRAIGFGVSQSGRFLRDFLYLGFNEDTRGRAWSSTG